MAYKVTIKKAFPELFGVLLVKTTKSKSIWSWVVHHVNEKSLESVETKYEISLDT